MGKMNPLEKCEKCPVFIFEDVQAYIRKLERDKNWASENYDLIREENEQLEAELPKWISVEDKQPTESDGTVLVCFPDVSPYNLREQFINAKHDRRVQTAKYSQYSNRWYIGDMCGVSEIAPTHWMPLPEPPKEEEK